jgi:flagellar hook assembly protein FlgD
MPSVSSSTSGSNDRNYLDWINNKSDDTSTDETSKSKKIYNAVFEDKKDSEVGFKDLFSLMINQLTHQDFLNPTDDSQYLAQMTQIASMSAMQELAKYSQSQYMSGFLGKEVTVSKFEIGGETTTETGIVTTISWDANNENYKYTVNDKQYTIADITNVSLEGHAPKINEEKEIEFPEGVKPKEDTTEKSSEEEEE